LLKITMKNIQFVQLILLKKIYLFYNDNIIFR
jgi:hypothetical protein